VQVGDALETPDGTDTADGDDDEIAVGETEAEYDACNLSLVVLKPPVLDL
jgi:hypothetical protein